jgi:hypothetical protein
MFRRKTDQVYATLQQVQRRITEQSGAEPAAKPVTQQSPAMYPFNQDASPAPTKSDTTPLPAPVKRQSLQLSPELASTLAVLWLITVVMAFVLGRAQGHKNQEDPGAGYAAGAAGNREPTPGVPAVKDVAPASSDPRYTMPGRGGDVLVLASVARADNKTEQSFVERAKSLNEEAGKAFDRGYRSWFGVRHPSSGGLQLVFGYLNGQFGVDRSQFESLASEMRAVDAKFKEPHWMSISEK